MLSFRKIVAAAVVCLSAVFFSTSGFAAQYAVDITISGLENCDLSSFNIDISYDSDLLSVVDYSLTSELGSLDGIDADNLSLEEHQFGTYNINVCSWLYDFTGQSNAFTLATITFEADNAQDLSGIFLSSIDLGDENEDPIAFTVSGTNIAAVPVPSTLSLMAFGVAGLLGFAIDQKGYNALIFFTCPLNTGSRIFLSGSFTAQRCLLKPGRRYVKSACGRLKKGEKKHV